MTLYATDEHGTDTSVPDGGRLSVGRNGDLHLGPQGSEDLGLSRCCYFVSASRGTIIFERNFTKRPRAITVRNIVTGESALIPGGTDLWATTWRGISIEIYTHRRYSIHCARDAQPTQPSPMPDGALTDNGDDDTGLDLRQAPDRALAMRCIALLDTESHGVTNEELAKRLATSHFEARAISASAFTSRLSQARATYAWLVTAENGTPEAEVSIEDIAQHFVRWSKVDERTVTTLFGERTIPVTIGDGNA